jgi:oligopeptide transport system ATP-binding protein
VALMERPWNPLLSVRDLRTSFATDGGVVRAVDGVSFDVHAGEVLGIVGESGSGKSVTALSVLGLVARPPGRIDGGQVLWKGRDLLRLSARELRSVRGAEIAMVFQDPLASLNPVLTVGAQVAEMLRAHGSLSRRQARARAIELLELVGVPEPDRRVDDHPHQLSGGQRQRAMIAMAVACGPELLIADEPTTALDVTTQAQVLEVLRRAADEKGSALVLVSHDLGVVAGMADRVAVLYAGRIVEEGTVDDVFSRPRMPYTWGLLESSPRLDRHRSDRLATIAGQPPSLLSPPSGCRFHPRCCSADPDLCPDREPELVDLAGGHRARCHFASEPGWWSPAERRARPPDGWHPRLVPRGVEARP